MAVWRRVGGGKGQKRWRPVAAEENIRGCSRRYKRWQQTAGLEKRQWGVKAEEAVASGGRQNTYEAVANRSNRDEAAGSRGSREVKKWHMTYKVGSAGPEKRLQIVATEGRRKS